MKFIVPLFVMLDLTATKIEEYNLYTGAYFKEMVIRQINIPR